MTFEERVWNALAIGGLSQRQLVDLVELEHQQVATALWNLRRDGVACTTGHTHRARWFRTPGVKYPGDMRGMKPRSRANLSMEAKKRSKVPPALSWEALL